MNPMTPTETLMIANAASTPEFNFGSDQLAAWNAQYRHTGVCHTASDWYVVVHLSPNGQEFRVLRRWITGLEASLSFDVPE